jgi:hypothetical protein
VAVMFLASPPSIHSVRANAKVLNRFVRSVAVVGLLIGAVGLSSAPSTGLERTAKRINQEGAQERVARVSEPLGPRAAPELRDVRPAVRPFVGPSAVAWGGDL